MSPDFQEFGEEAKYVKITGNGKNALDFHIAYYLGELTSKDPKAFYHVISKDTGYDPLIKHLKKNKIKACRQSDLAEIPLLRISNEAHPDEKIKEVIMNLKGRGQSRPRKVKTLSNTINSLFSEKMNDKEMDIFIKSLAKNEFIYIHNDSITYNLNKKLSDYQ